MARTFTVTEYQWPWRQASHTLTITDCHQFRSSDSGVSLQPHKQQLLVNKINRRVFERRNEKKNTNRRKTQQKEKQTKGTMCNLLQFRSSESEGENGNILSNFVTFYYPVKKDLSGDQLRPERREALQSANCASENSSVHLGHEKLPRTRFQERFCVSAPAVTLPAACTPVISHSISTHRFL